MSAQVEGKGGAKARSMSATRETQEPGQATGAGGLRAAPHRTSKVHASTSARHVLGELAPKPGECGSKPSTFLRELGVQMKSWDVCRFYLRARADMAHA